MNKLLLVIVSLSLLAGCRKKTADPYEGLLFIRFSAGQSFFLGRTELGELFPSTEGESWRVEKVSAEKYSLSPISDLSRVLSSTGIGVTLAIRPETLGDQELFVFERQGSSSEVRIRPAGSTDHLAFSYGLSAEGEMTGWGFILGPAGSCHDSFPLAVTTGCQYIFELIHQP